MISLAPRAGPSFRLLLYIKLLLVHMSRLCTIYYIQWFRQRWRLVIGVVSVCWTVCFDDLAKEGQERCSYFSQKSCRIRGECRTWYLGRWTWRGHGHSGWNEAPVASTQFGSPKNHTNMVAHKGTFCKTLTTPGVLRGRESSALRGPGYPNRCPSLPRPRRDKHAPPPQSYATPTPTRSRARWPRPIPT